MITAVEVRLTRILDLTDGRVRQALRISAERLVREPRRLIQERGEESVTQAISRLVRASGLKALVAPSAARAGGANLAIFPDNLAADDRLDIVNPDHLPDPPDS